MAKTAETAKTPTETNKGTVAALRETLVSVRDDLWTLMGVTSESRQQYLAIEISRKIRAALALPLRNCDVGTAEEQLKRQYDTMCNTTKACPDSDWSCKKCFAIWSQMPYEEKAGNE